MEETATHSQGEREGECMRQVARRRGAGLGLIVVIAVLGGCGTSSTSASSTSSRGPTALADTGPALYGVGIACGGDPAATATCAAETGTPTVCRTVNGASYCQPAESIFAIGEQSGIVRWRHAEPTVGYASQVQFLPAGDRLYAFVGAPDGTGPGDLTARRASDGAAIWQRHLPSFASQMFLAGSTLFVFRTSLGDETNQLTVLRTSDGSVVSSTLLQLGGRLLVHDGIIYGCGQDHSITALRASDGSQLWNTSPGWDSRLYMLDLCFFTYADGNLYVQREQSDTLYALRAADGKVLWSETSQYQVLLAAGDGLVLVGDDLGKQVAALRASDGRPLWRMAANGECCKGFAPASIISGATIYLGRTTSVEALRASDGHMIWQQQVAGHSVELCDVAADRVFVLSYLPPGSRTGLEPFKGDSVMALSAATGQTIWTTQASSDTLTLAADTST
jgi:outer membrane protein assembly factor BamB